MGIVSAIIALLRAVPSLERLFLKIADGVKEAKARERYNAKMSDIDAAIAAARTDGVRDSSGVEWSEDPDRSPPVSEGGTIRARMDKGGVEESS